MSRPRYRWWSYVKAVIRSYPQLMAAYAAEFPDDVNDIVVKDLQCTEQREYIAVRQAVNETSTVANGEDRMRLISLVFWNEAYTLEGAAMRIPCSSATAWRWHREFIRLVACKMGLLDER